MCWIGLSVTFAQCPDDNTVEADPGENTVFIPTTPTDQTECCISPGEFILFCGLIHGEEYTFTTCAATIPQSSNGSFDPQMTLYAGDTSILVGFSDDLGTTGCMMSAEVTITWDSSLYEGTCLRLLIDNQDTIQFGGPCSHFFNNGLRAQVGYRCNTCTVATGPCTYETVDPAVVPPDPNSVSVPNSDQDNTFGFINPGEWLEFCGFIHGEEYTISTCNTTFPGLIQGAYDPQMTLYSSGGGVAIATNNDIPFCGLASEITFVWDTMLYGGSCAELMMDNAEMVNGGPCSNAWLGGVRGELGYRCNSCAPLSGPCPYDNFEPSDTSNNTIIVMDTTLESTKCCMDPGQFLEVCGLLHNETYIFTTCATSITGARDGNFDPELTAYTPGGGTVVAHNKDLVGCGMSAEIMFTWDSTLYGGSCLELLMDNGSPVDGGPCSNEWTGGGLRAVIGYMCVTCSDTMTGPNCPDTLRLTGQMNLSGTYSASEFIQTSGDIVVTGNTLFNAPEILIEEELEVPDGIEFVTDSTGCERTGARSVKYKSQHTNSNQQKIGKLKKQE